MKILSWNVNGLRAVLSKAALADVKNLLPDILCLQEIKARQDQLTDEQAKEFSDFQGYWNPAERPGYSGVASFCKETPDLLDFSLGEERFDVEGRSIRMDYGNLVLFNLYVPNGQRDQDRLNYKLDFYARLLEICDDLHSEGKQIIIFGDMNTAHRPIDLRNPKQNEKTSGFLPEERAWIDNFLDHEFVDIYREIYPERVQYTWWTYRVNARQRNIGWRLDYFLVSKDLVGKVVDAKIYEELMGSDHCPIGLEIEIK
jgi:exodeoxyribonuclease-3